MESLISNVYFEKYVESKLQNSEELIKKTRSKLGVQMPRFWKLKQMKSYSKQLKQIKEEIDHLHWMVKEMDYFSSESTVN